jgi:hypothetical protein
MGLSSTLRRQNRDALPLEKIFVPTKISSQFHQKKQTPQLDFNQQLNLSVERSEVELDYQNFSPRMTSVVVDLVSEITGVIIQSAGLI